MTISLLIDTAGGSNFEANHLRNVASLHVGGLALATETLDVTGTLGVSNTVKTDKIKEFTAAAGIIIDDDMVVSGGTLTVGSSTSTGTILFHNTTGSITQTRFANPAAFDIRRAQGTQATPTAVLSGNTLANYQVSGYDGSAYQLGFILTVNATENWSGSVQGAEAFFQLNLTGATTFTERLRFMGEGDVRIGTGIAIATSATAGFLLIPGCAGTPTGNPTNDGVGAVALVYDTTNNLLYANDGGGWVAVNSP